MPLLHLWRARAGLREPASPGAPTEAVSQELPAPDRRMRGCGYVPPPRPVIWLFVHQNADGSWGGGQASLEGLPLSKTGVTALAMLPLLGAGYSPTSKAINVFKDDDPLGEAAKGRTDGGQITKAVEWLLSDEREDGTFRSDNEGPFDQILGALALSQAYGFSGRPLWKHAAELAVGAVLRRQKRDGSWEGAAPTAWAVLALNSARQSDLSVDPESYGRALLSHAYPGHPGTALALTLARTPRARALADLANQRLFGEAEKTDPGRVSFWCMASLAMFAYDGPRARLSGDPRDERAGPRWERWSPILQQVVRSQYAGGDSVKGESVGDAAIRKSLILLTAEVYYRFANALTVR
jgi:hypothetical protein